MNRCAQILFLAAFAALPAAGEMRVLATVVDARTGRPIAGLTAADFLLYEDKILRRVEHAEFASPPASVMLIADATMSPELLRPLASAFIGELSEKDKMSLVSYDSSAEMMQDFTSSQDVLRGALARIKYGSAPRVLDALTAAMESGGFQNAGGRRVILLLTSGLEGRGKAQERDVARLARRNRVSVFPVIAGGANRPVFEDLARQTGGACYNLRDLQKGGEPSPAALVLGAIRSHYILTITGNLGLKEKLRLEINRAGKLAASVLSLE